MADSHSQDCHRPLAGQALPCWKTIGVWGDGSCPELKRHVHCFNCPVFGAAGRGLLEREAPAGYAGEWQSALRHADEGAAQAATPVLIFRLGPEWLALPAAAIGYVTEKKTVHRLPHRSDRVLAGLVNIQGELHLSFNLGALLELPAETPEGIALSRRVYPRLLLCRRPAHAFAFAADEVFGITPLDPAALQAVPVTVGKALATFTRGLFNFRDRAVGLLDDELLAHSLLRQHISM